MKLISNGMSPYGRKVAIVVYELGLAERVTFIDAMPRERPQDVTPFNPLGKIPVLETDDGRRILDSRVICQYLDAEYGGNKLVPASGPKRWDVLSIVAAADGIIEAAILVKNERLRPAGQRSESFIDWHAQKIGRSLGSFEERFGDIGEAFDLGTIALGCAVSYVRRRLEEYEALKSWPRLKTFVEELSRRPSFSRTAPKS